MDQLSHFPRCLTEEIKKYYKSYILVCVCLVTQLCLTLCDPMDWDTFPGKYWSGLPFSPPGDLPDPGIEPRSPARQAESLLLSHGGSPVFIFFPPDASLSVNFMVTVEGCFLNPQNYKSAPRAETDC